MKQMRRYVYFLCAALLTFAAGVGSTLLRTAVVRPFSPDEVQVKFVKSSSDYHITLEYEVVNGSAHDLHYTGYAKGSNVGWVVMHGEQLAPKRFICVTGLGEHTLGPGESERFRVFVTETGPARVGFGFGVGAARVEHTFWGDELFVEQPPSADGN